MSTDKRPYDPLAVLPRAEFVRARLRESERVTRRLRYLLRVCERLENTEAKRIEASNA